MAGRKNGDEDANAGKKSPEIEIIRLKLGIWVRVRVVKVTELAELRTIHRKKIGKSQYSRNIH